MRKGLRLFWSSMLDKSSTRKPLAIRVGIDSRDEYVETTAKNHIPVMVSANNLMGSKARRRRMVEASRGEYVPISEKSTGKPVPALDIALDSGGFVAAISGGFRFTQDEYLDLVEELAPTWYAAMDYCCEPEIAADGAKVAERIRMTIESLESMLENCRERGMELPMPVAQGWKPEDYLGCLERIERLFPEGFPARLGIGSVCRRKLHGEDGLLAILGTVTGWLKSRGHHHTQLHLFGVKGPTLSHLGDFEEQVESIDSFAHASRARFDAGQRGVPCNRELKVHHLHLWLAKNQARIAPVVEAESPEEPVEAPESGITSPAEHQCATVQRNETIDLKKFKKILDGLSPPG